MIGIPLVESRGVVDQNGVDFQHPKQKDQPRTHFQDRPAVHVVVGIVEEECLGNAQTSGHLDRIALVLENDIAGRCAFTRHRVIGHGDEHAGVALIEELEHRAAGEDWDVITMWLDGSQNFTLMGFSRPLAFHRDIQRVRSASRSTRFQFALALRFTICQKHAHRKRTAKELSSLHDTCLPGIAILAVWVDTSVFLRVFSDLTLVFRFSHKGACHSYFADRLQHRV